MIDRIREAQAECATKEAAALSDLTRATTAIRTGNRAYAIALIERVRTALAIADSAADLAAAYAQGKS